MRLVTPTVRRLFLVACAVAIRLAAQDVQVTPITWNTKDPAPDQLPEFKHPLRPEIPYDLKKTPDLGYVLINFFADENGKIGSWNLFGTLPAYEHCVVDAEQYAGMAQGGGIKPAMSAGKAVESRARFSVIFNPASAPASGPEATPRLLAVRPAFDKTKSDRTDDQATSPRVVWAIVTIDEHGMPSDVHEAPEDLVVPFKNSLKHWSFAPARHAGIAVAQDIRVPFIVIPAVDSTGPKNSTPPIATYQVRPLYPYSMRASKMRGEVLVDFLVDKEGKVQNATVFRTLNPEFNQPALDSVNQWRFKPGTVNGVPVITHMQVPITFSLSLLQDGGRDGVEIEHASDNSKLPEDLRVDVEAKVRGIVLPVYPYAFLRDDVDGTARVNYLIDAAGRVVSTKVSSADKPEFGLALQAAVERFDYNPALKKGSPNPSVMGFEQEFSTGDTRLCTPDDDRLLRMERRHPEKIVSAKSLDEPLKPMTIRMPVFPRSLLQKDIDHGSATVELLINEDGLPRLPRIVSSSEPAFGYAAVQAAVLWSFNHPKVKGESAVTRVQIPFNFEAAAPKP